MVLYQKLLMWFGAFCLASIILIGGFIGAMNLKGNALDESSKQYAESSVPQIVKGWKKDDLVNRAAPELTKIINSNLDQVDALFKKGALLGDFEKITDIKGSASMNYNLFADDQSVTANYSMTVKFKNDVAIVQLRLLRGEDEWKVLLFNITSPSLMK